MADPLLQKAGRRLPDCALDPLGLKEPVNVWIGETRIGPKINARDLTPVPLDNGLERTIPTIGAVDFAGTKRAFPDRQTG